jgi:hypothetical protein
MVDMHLSCRHAAYDSKEAKSLCCAEIAIPKSIGEVMEEWYHVEEDDFLESIFICTFLFCISTYICCIYWKLQAIWVYIA